LDVLEEERFSAEVGGGGTIQLRMRVGGFRFGDAVRDGGDFQYGIHFGGDAGEFALLVKEIEEV
jgi:hypothetical protein